MYATINSQLCTVAKTFSQPGVPVVLDATDTQKQAEYIRFTMLSATETESSIGSAVHRRHVMAGVATAQVFTAPKAGSYKALQYASRFAELYRNKSWIKNPLSGGNPVRIIIDRVDLTTAGERDGYYQVNVVIRFRAEQVVAL